MYKWHVNSAIGRGRPVANDLARVADGIAASLRQFSISARRCADEDGSSPSSRNQRSARAIREVSDLAPPAPPPKGIDARSLAAKPPSKGFTIHRVDTPIFSDTLGRPGKSNRPPSSSSSSSPSSFSPRPSFRGGSGGGPRRGASAGAGMRGGGFRGRGRGAPRGRGLRGRNSQGPRPKRPKFAEEIDLEILPYTDEELPEYNTIVGGIPEPYNPITSHASLAGWGPSVISSPQGLKEMVDAKLGVAVDRKYPGWNGVEWHRNKIASEGLTVFKDKEERQALRESQKGKLGAKYSELSEAQKEKLSKQWIGGHYDGPVAVDRKDVLGQVKKYATANGTFLVEDAKQFEQDVASLLPKAKARPVQKAS